MPAEKPSKRSVRGSTRSRGAFALAVVLLLGLGVAPLVFNHFQKQSLRQRIAAAERVLGTDHGALESLEALQSAVRDFERRFAGSQQYVPPTPELADALRGLTRAMERYDLSEQSIETQPTRRYAKYCVIPVFVRFEGDFLSAYGTLRAIEQVPRLIRTDRLSMRRVGSVAEAAPPRVAVDLELSTFYAPGQQEASP